MSTVKKLISLDESLAREIEIISEALDITQRELVENALDFYFDFTDGIIAKKVADKVKNKKMKTYSLKETKDRLGIE